MDEKTGKLVMLPPDMTADEARKKGLVPVPEALHALLGKEPKEGTNLRRHKDRQVREWAIKEMKKADRRRKRKAAKAAKKRNR